MEEFISDFMLIVIVLKNSDGKWLAVIFHQDFLYIFMYVNNMLLLRLHIDQERHAHTVVANSRQWPGRIIESRLSAGDSSALARH